MSFGFDQILPSLQSLGLWSYWIIGMASTLEAFFVTGIVMPGTLVVDLGGVLVERGVLDFLDLVWFVAIGSFIGGQLSYWVGVRGAASLKRHVDIEKAPAYLKAKRLFARHGGLALVIGRFFGPVAGLVPFAAALSGMPRKRFTLWNLFGAFPYALAHVSLGYFLGDAFFKMGPFLGRVMLFGLIVLLAVALLWYLTVRITRMLPFALSVANSMLKAAGENPDMRRWITRHPRLSRLLFNRVDTSHFFGLTATLLSAAFLYILFIWVGTVFDFLMTDAIRQIDMRLANLIHAFWTPELLRIFTLITTLGGARVIVVLLVGFLIALWLWKRVDLMLGLAVAIIGNKLMVGFLKNLFDRPRPEFAYFKETSGSFPSGHAAASVAFYGMVFYIIWRLRLLRPLPALGLAVTMAFAIGLSRIYLIEHYLSDVLNGYLVGGLWLVIGIALSEWWRETHAHGHEGANRRLMPGGIVLLTLVAAAGLGYSHIEPRHYPAVDTSSEVITDIANQFTTGKAPATSTSITGNALEPISLIIIARDAAAFEAALLQAGWVKADKPNISSLARAAFAAWGNLPDRSAPITPYFWNRVPNDYGFQKPTADETLRKRHHARFWCTRFVTQDGARIFVGTASFDNGLVWGVLHHIAPNIDGERDTLVADMKATGLISDSRQFQLSTPHLGADIAGDPWFTDGKAVVLRVRP